MSGVHETTELEFPIWRRMIWQVRVCIGRIINYYLIPAEQLELIERRAYVKRARSPGSRLTNAEIAALETWMLSVQDRDLRRTYFETTKIENTFQGLLIPLVNEILERDKQVRAVVNVGVNYAYVDSVLARAHPDIKFIGVDFAPNLRVYNSEFICSNLDFICGYALELLEGGLITPDVLMFSSCAYEIKGAELRLYCASLPIGSYIVFNEPLYNFPGGGLLDPMDVASSDSAAVYSHVGVDQNQLGPLGFTHNYRKIIEEEGFEVLHYHAFRPSFTDLRMVHVIGRKSASA